jgi:Protein of unknown function (DUF3179)
VTPTIDGQVHTFSEHGLYDGLFLMMDQESGTYWDHLTGDAVYGPLVGTRLEISNLRQTVAGQILGEEPAAQISISEQTGRMGGNDRQRFSSLLSRVGGRLNQFFQKTVKKEDDRMPTMDLGMGVWEGEAARYYSYADVTAQGNAVLDQFQGRTLLVYLDPTALTLVAFFIDAESFEWDDDVLRLSNGAYIERGVAFDANDERIRGARPMQVPTRWYGFSLTFPDTEIYGK